MAEKKPLDIFAVVMLIVGAVNWGLSVFGINLVSMFFKTSIWATIFYALIGLSAVLVGYNLVSGKAKLPKNVLEATGMVLLVIGGLNWGLGIFNFNVVEWLVGFTGMLVLIKVIYFAVGLAGVHKIYALTQE